MNNHLVLVTSAIVLVAAITGCLAPHESSPSAPMPPASMNTNPMPVPGTRADDGDLCDRENEWGQSCVRDGERCADGGNAPASLQCRFWIWRCVPDSRFHTCQIRPTNPPVPPRPRGHVTVTCGGPASSEVLTNSGNFRVRSMGIAAEGREVQVRRIPGRIAWSTYGQPHFVSGQNGTRYFRDLQARTEDTMIVMPPVQFLSSGNRQVGSTLLRGSVTVPVGTRRVLYLEAGVASFEEETHEMTGGWFAFDFGGENPRTIFSANDVLYTDTGESVPETDIEYDGSCFEEVRNHQFRVIPRFADLYANRGLLALSSTIVGNGRAAMIDVAVGNDGHEAGTMTAFTLDVNTRANGTLGIFFRPMVTRCDLTTVDGRNIGSGTIRDTEVEFSTVNAVIPGRSVEHFLVRCDLVFPTEAARAMSAEWYEIRVGALSNSFQMRTDGDPGRIQGTLVLDQNRLSSTSDVVAITLRPFGQL